MANASFQRPIEDIVECPICTETLKDTRVLPCIHTFCLKCIEQVGRDKKRGDKVQCPCCRKQFQVPIGGFAKLPKNTFVEKLLDVQCAMKTEWANSAKICTMSGHGKKNYNQSLAIWHCVECDLQMCGSCRSAHLRQGKTSFHHVFSDQQESPCKEHPNKQLDRFCKTCKTPVCGECCASKHRGHEWANFVHYVGTLQKEIEELRLHNNQISSQHNRQYRELPFDATNDYVRTPCLRIVLYVPIDEHEERNKVRKFTVEVDRFKSQIRLREVKNTEGHGIVVAILVAVIISLWAIWRNV